MTKSPSEMQPVTRSLEILTPPSGSTVGPGVFIYNRFPKAQVDGTAEEHGAESTHSAAGSAPAGSRDLRSS
jgi:hypothetical protein